MFGRNVKQVQPWWKLVWRFLEGAKSEILFDARYLSKLCKDFILHIYYKSILNLFNIFIYINNI